MSTNKLFNSNHSILNLLNNPDLDLSEHSSWFNIDGEQSYDLDNDSILSDYDNVSVQSAKALSVNASSFEVGGVDTVSHDQRAADTSRISNCSQSYQIINSEASHFQDSEIKLSNSSNFVMPKVEISNKIKLISNLQISNRVMNKIKLNNFNSKVTDDLVIVINDGKFINLKKFFKNYEIKLNNNFILCNYNHHNTVDLEFLEILLELKPIFILNFKTFNQLIMKLNKLNTIHLRSNPNSITNKQFKQYSIKKRKKLFIKKLKASKNIDRLDPLNLITYFNCIKLLVTLGLINVSFKYISQKNLLGSIIAISSASESASINSMSFSSLSNENHGLNKSSIILKRMNYKLLQILNSGFKNFLSWCDYMVYNLSLSV